MRIFKHIKDYFFTPSPKTIISEVGKIPSPQTELKTENELLKKELNLLKKIESQLHNMQSKKQEL